MKRLLCLLLIVMLKFTLQAQRLFIIDSNATPVNAKVEALYMLEGKRISAVTENGFVTLPTAGSFQVRVHAIGFQDLQKTFVISQNQTITIALTPATIVTEDVVVTAQVGAKTAKNSIISVTVIDNKKIQLMGAQNLRDVLTNQMGLRLSQDNILGSSISMQGLSGENVKILIDGVPVIGRQNGNVDISQIDMNNVERIEIIEGPMSVNFGTNALGGVINIITKKGNSIHNSFAIKTHYETIGTYNSSFTYNTHVKKLTTQLTASRNFFDGWSVNDSYEAIPMQHIADTNRFKTWKPKMQYNLGLNLGGRIKNFDLNFKSNYFNESILNRGKPTAPYFESAFDDTYKTTRLDNVVMFNFSKDQRKSCNSQVSCSFYKRLKNTYYRDLTSLIQKISSNPEDHDTTNYYLLNLRSTRKSYFKKLNYEYGVDLNFEGTSGQRIKDHSQSLYDLASFGIAEYNLTDKLTLRGGVRVAYNSKYKAPILPSLNLKWFINTKNIVRFSYAQGFKAPGLKELYFYFVDFNHNIIGNTSLKAEKSNSINIQYNYVTMYKKALVKFELKAFYNYIENMITLAQIQGLSYTYANVGIYKTKGLQCNGDIILGNLKINAGLNYTGRYNQLIEGAAITTFSFSPEFNSALGYNFKKQKTQVSFYYKFNGKLPSYFKDANDNLIIQNIGSYHWADASVTKSIFKTVLIGAGIKNIFNIQNISTANGTGVHQTENKMPIGAGRFYFLSVNYTLSK